MTIETGQGSSTTPAAASRGMAGWALASAALALLLAWIFDWKARDLAWSLWLSSLVLGYVTILVSSFGGRGNPLAAIAKLLFFTVHFGLFHFIHSAFLSFLLPIDGAGEGPSATLYASVVRDYWPMVLVSGVAAIPRWRHDGRASGGLLSAGRGVVSAYMGVVRIHLMIFALAAVSFLGADHLLVFAVVYLLSLLPIEASTERALVDAQKRSAGAT